MKELYKKIIGYEKLYEISNHGNVKSLKRIIKGRHGLTTIQEKILKPSLVKGYKAVNLYKNGKPYNAKIHRLIAIHFIPKVKGKICINHKNGIKTDNRIENLEWCTYSENAIHAYSNKLKHSEKKILKLDLLGNFLEEFESLSKASQSINKYKGRGNISKCCSGSKKTAYGYKWQYK